MRVCIVRMKGNDDQTHSMTVEASSLFDAASQAIQQWATFWWWPVADTLMEVEDDGVVHRVRSKRIGEWRSARSGTTWSNSNP